MKITSHSLGALVVALLACRPTLAIDPPQTPPQSPPPTYPGGPPATAPQPGAKSPLPEVLPNSPSPSPSQTPALAPRADGLPPGSVTSPWIDYARPGCCGPYTGGPIGSEFYLRTGPSIPVSTGILHETLNTGWMTQIGARTLFFNQPTTS